MFSAEIDYSDNSLEPVLSTETIKFHFGKHHVGYYNTLVSLVKDTEYEDLSLTEIIIRSRNNNAKIFNNASQLFNHNFYWKCLKLNVDIPQGKLYNSINEQFGNFDTFLQKYIGHAATLFGSGWAWLVDDAGELKFLNTQNGENPIGTNLIPLCVIDLWEHAYYIDYRNNRSEYLSKIVKNCINWNFCESQMR